MVEDAGSCHAAFVHAAVEAVGAIDTAERAHAHLDEGHDVCELRGAGLRQAASVTRGDRHEMAGGIGKGVQDEEGLIAAAKDERPAVIAAGQRAAKNTADIAGRRSGDVLHAPRRPQAIHAAQVLTSSRRRLPTLKNGTRFSGTLTLSPVLGFRPLRELRCRMRKLPKPRSSTLSPLLRASVMLSKTVLTMSSVSFLVSVATFATSSISSALVMKETPFEGPTPGPGPVAGHAGAPLPR